MRSVIILGLVVTFGLLGFSAMWVGFGANNYLFQDGSTPLTGDWDVGNFDLNLTGDILSSSAGITDLGSTDGELGHIYLADNKDIFFGNDQDMSLEYYNVNYLRFNGQLWTYDSVFPQIRVDSGTHSMDLGVSGTIGFFKGSAGLTDFKWRNNDNVDLLQVDYANEYVKIQDLVLNDHSEVTLDVDGEITVTSSYHRLDTFEDAATDNLDVINGQAQTGYILVLKSTANARDVTVRDNAVSGGNIQLAGSVPFAFATIRDRLMLMYDHITSAWVELSRSIN